MTVALVTQAKDSPARTAGYPLSAFPLPAYPSEMARAGITGEVTARVVVGKDGRVRNVVLTNSSQREFEAGVVAAIKLWRFCELPEARNADLKGLIVDCVLQFSLE